MSLSLPEGCDFYIARRSIPADYEMPSLEVAIGFYEMGYMISGDRTTITPAMTYTQHAGFLGTLSPFIYHRTIPASSAPYESILVKFTPSFVKPFTDLFGIQALDKIFSHPTNRFRPDDQNKIFHLLMNMLEEYQEDSPYKDFNIQCMLFQILTTVLQKRLPDDSTIIHEAPLTPPIIEAVYYMEKHYAQKLNINMVAKISGFSPAYFSRIFQSQLGKSYSDYLCDIRLKHVKELLLTTDKSIAEIALETGYSYPGNLTEQFKRKTGITPVHYRKNR